ncbi:MAG TPA: hypothetical protein VHV32_18190 [Candidatus Angelobacter sp.]|nr:hypothetical protein [Candidatus Angelobacter sp.]
MANEPQSAEAPSLSATVERCLTILQSLSLALDTYGNEDHAAMLHEVISQFQKAVPAQSGSEPDSMDFIVNATFKVSRQQVAGAMWRAFGSQITWFRVVEVIEPPTLRFRSIEHLALRMVDYPLNEGGSIGIVSTEPSSDVFRLDLKSIRRGLEDLATKYPRHFADLVNENTDAITANVLLQCCLFGELIYE